MSESVSLAVEIIEREIDAMTREWLEENHSDLDPSGYPPYHYMLVKDRLVLALTVNGRQVNEPEAAEQSNPNALS